LNGKLDLAQAEAVADLIAASDLRAARAARRSLQGEFSQRVDALAQTLLALRVQLEASIDFADEELDADGEAALRRRLDDARVQLDALLAAAERGRRLRDGLHAVIVGPPNAGKSSLLNALAGSDRAIVTDVPGTTRDLLQETIRVDGVELTLVDTAGLREAGDAIEREGMRRARAELERADAALVVLDARDPGAGRLAVESALFGVPEILWLHNKSDLLPAGVAETPDAIPISAHTGAGLPTLHARLRALAGGDGEGAFSARARHVEALRRGAALLDEAVAGFAAERPELAADSLRRAHDALGEITGRVLPDALLGHIFATFCVGK
jgi:tRNA modification GTPase